MRLLSGLLVCCCLMATMSVAHAGQNELIVRIKQANAAVRVAQQTCTTTCGNTKWTHKCNGTDVCSCSCDQDPVCQCKPYPGSPSGS